VAGGDGESDGQWGRSLHVGGVVVVGRGSEDDLLAGNENPGSETRFSGFLFLSFFLSFFLVHTCETVAKLPFYSTLAGFDLATH
jgi:hypothetical protein